MGKIERLAPDLVNQIAAGEVVERPASVVKELIENALDANASRIEVWLKEGGLEEITILDNGSGMDKEDLALCVAPHATSKLRAPQDLEAIATFGFRGEALASIASVAQVQIVSRTSEMNRALSGLWDKGEQQGAFKPEGAPVGTRITVRHLFSQVPARLKFMRSAATEFSHCSRVVREVALGNPNVAFSLHHQGRQIAAFSSTSVVGRVEQCLKPDWSPQTIRESADDVELEAYLSPGHWISDKGDLYLYINKRPVRNRALLSAVRRSYLDTLGPHHEPSGVVYLTIRKDWVDVNVHPQKWEVRLLKQERLFSWIGAVVRKSISQAPTYRPVTIVAEPKTGTYPSEPLTPIDLGEEAFFPARNPPVSTPNLSDPAPPPPVSFARRLRYLGQLKASYLICEDERGMILIDQHALHEKQVFEKLQLQLESGNLSVQTLLVPRILRLSTDLAPIFEEHAEAFRKLGFDSEIFGDGDMAVRSHPVGISEDRLQAVLEESLRNLATAESSPELSVARAFRPVLATMACHSVVRANQTLAPREAERLLEALDEIDQGWTCPHGRPVAFRMDFNQIKKHFERL